MFVNADIIYVVDFFYSDQFLLLIVSYTSVDNKRVWYKLLLAAGRLLVGMNQVNRTEIMRYRKIYDGVLPVGIIYIFCFDFLVANQQCDSENIECWNSVFVNMATNNSNLRSLSHSWHAIFWKLFGTNDVDCINDIQRFMG